VFNNVDIANLTEEERIDKLEEISNKSTNAFLAAMVAELSSIPNRVGICLIETIVHGYLIQTLAIQHHDGVFEIQKWIEGPPNVEMYSSSIDLDLRQELMHLRQDGIVLKKYGINHNLDHKSNMEGKYATIYIAVETGAEWLNYPYPLKGGEYDNNAANRILCAIWSMEKDVTLV